MSKKARRSTTISFHNRLLQPTPLPITMLYQYQRCAVRNIWTVWATCSMIKFQILFTRVAISRDDLFGILLIPFNNPGNSFQLIPLSRATRRNRANTICRNYKSSTIAAAKKHNMCYNDLLLFKILKIAFDEYCFLRI
jgi:hypothetical protein